VTVGVEVKGVFFPDRDGAAPAGAPPVPEDLGVEEALAPAGSAGDRLMVGLFDFKDDPDGDGTLELGAGIETEGAAFGVVLGRRNDPPPLVDGRAKLDWLEPLDRPKLPIEDELDRGLV